MSGKTVKIKLHVCKHLHVGYIVAKLMEMLSYDFNVILVSL